jgi:hypothetical protein
MRDARSSVVPSAYKLLQKSAVPPVNRPPT